MHQLGHPGSRVVALQKASTANHLTRAQPNEQITWNVRRGQMQLYSTGWRDSGLVVQGATGIPQATLTTFNCVRVSHVIRKANKLARKLVPETQSREHEAQIHRQRPFRTEYAWQKVPVTRRGRHETWELMRMDGLAGKRPLMLVDKKY